MEGLGARALCRVGGPWTAHQVGQAGRQACRQHSNCGARATCARTCSHNRHHSTRQHRKRGGLPLAQLRVQHAQQQRHHHHPAEQHIGAAMHQRAQHHERLQGGTGQGARGERVEASEQPRGWHAGSYWVDELRISRNAHHASSPGSRQATCSHCNRGCFPSPPLPFPRMRRSCPAAAGPPSHLQAVRDRLHSRPFERRD